MWALKKHKNAFSKTFIFAWGVLTMRNEKCYCYNAFAVCKNLAKSGFSSKENKSSVFLGLLTVLDHNC